MGKGVALLGSDDNPGHHWTMAVYNSLANEVIYGDSLGQDMPDEFENKLNTIIEDIYSPVLPISKCYCHNPDVHRNSRQCIQGTCSSNYPWQTCSNICGVVVIIMASGNVFKGRVRAIIHGKPVLTYVGLLSLLWLVLLPNCTKCS